MFRNLMEFLIIMILSLLLTFVSVKRDINSRLDMLFYELKYRSFDYKISDTIYLKFDYEEVCLLVDEYFQNYDVEIVFIDDNTFVLKIEIDKLIYKETVEEKFYLQRGSLYGNYN